MEFYINSLSKELDWLSVLAGGVVRNPAQQKELGVSVSLSWAGGQGIYTTESSTEKNLQNIEMFCQADKAISFTRLMKKTFETRNFLSMDPPMNQSMLL